jgi:hypothetical protein
MRSYALLAALHLGIVFGGAVGLLPIEHNGYSIFYPLDLYMEYTGANYRFTFFAPSVGPQIRARLLRSGPQGTEEVQLLTNSAEVNTRINAMLTSSVKIPELQDVMARSWAALVSSSETTASNVTVIVESYQLPSMAEYRAGRRGVWEETYRGEFAIHSADLLVR